MEKVFFFGLNKISTEYFGSFEHYDLGEVLDMIYGYFEDFLKDLEANNEIKIKHRFVDTDKFDMNDAIYNDDDEKEQLSWKGNQEQKDLDNYERELKKIKANEIQK